MAGPIPPLAFDVPALRARVERRFRVYDVQQDEHVVAFFVDVRSGSEDADARTRASSGPQATIETEFAALKAELKEEGLVPLLKYQGGEHSIYVLRTPYRAKKRTWKLNLVLFLITIATTTTAGSFAAYHYFAGSGGFSDLTEMDYIRQALSAQYLFLGFLTFALPLMTILTVHEFGHYIAARRHGMDATLPYFIPVPPPPIFPTLLGTFGAFIQMREPMPNRKALFDIGVAGPLAGLAIAIPVLLIGFALMAAAPVQVTDTDDTLTLGTPLLYSALSWPFGFDDSNILTHPVAYAGWWGIFLTAFNLLPAGQLDGGHVAAAMFGERARYASYSVVVLLLALSFVPGFFGYPNSSGWILPAILVALLGLRHPPTLDGVSKLDSRRTWIGWGAFALGVLCFTPIPLSG